MVGDGHAVGITAEIAEYLPEATESRLGIDHPILPVEAQQLAKLLLVSRCSRRSGAAVLNGPKGFQLLKVRARSIPVEEALSLGAEDVGDLHDRPFHEVFLR